MLTSLSTVLAGLESPFDVPEQDLDGVVSRAFSLREKKGLLNAIRGMALSRPTLGGSLKSDYNGQTLWSTPLISLQGIAGTLHVLLDDDDRIAGVRFTLNDAGTPASAEILYKRLSAVAKDASVYTTQGTSVSSLGTPSPAVASLIKLVAIGAILDAIADGVIGTDTRVTVEDSDLSFLSVGLSESSIGTQISVVDLCIRAFAYSDNTAFDILLRLLNENAVVRHPSQTGWQPSAAPFIQTMRSSILASWGDNDGGTHAEIEARIRERSVQAVAHTLGKDYYVPLHVIVSIHRRIASSPVLAALRDLTPYPGFSYKGGSAPGVFAGSWVSAKNPDVAVAFTLNSLRPFGALEEAYSIDQALRFAQLAVSARES